MNVQSVPLRTPPRKTTTVMVAILTGHERHFWINPELLTVCLRMVFWQQETGNVLQVTGVHGVTPVDAARNKAVNMFLKSGAEWLLQIDNDIVPAPNVLSVLDDVGDRKIIGLPYAIEATKGDVTLAMGNPVDNIENPYESYTAMPLGWAKIHVVGTGCFFAHRDVFSAIAYPWFECRVIGGAHCCEDFGFCEKAHAAGFDVWTHSGFPCGHYRTINQTEHMISRHGQLVR